MNEVMTVPVGSASAPVDTARAEPAPGGTARAEPAPGGTARAEPAPGGTARAEPAPGGTAPVDTATDRGAAAPREQRVGDYLVRAATPADLDGARSVMLDTFYHELGHGYVADWHRDVIDLAGTYLHTAGHALFVAVTDPGAGGDEEVVATAAVRAHGPRHPPHPSWLVARYPDGPTAQLFRVYVRAAHRRRGLARALVGRAVEFVTAEPRYQRLYLHTDTRVPGAEAFWRSVAEPVWDARDGVADRPQTVHFDIPLPGRDGSA